MIQTPVATYQKEQTDGLNQRDLIVMCYKGAIKYLQDAKCECEKGDREAFCELLEKAHRVVFYLYTTLEMEQGGEIAEKLANLYAYIISQIYIVNATRRTETIDDIIKLLTTLQDGWEGLDLSAMVAGAAEPRLQTAMLQKIVSVEV